MIELKPSYKVWLTLLVAHIMSDGNFYPSIEHTIKSDHQVSRFTWSLYELNIEPGEAFRFLCRCYPEIVEDIRLCHYTQ